MGLLRTAGNVGRVWRAGSAAISSGLAVVWAQRALAEQPEDWQLGMQQAATPVREHMDAFHNELLVIITLITLFVMGLLIYTMVRFNARSHPVPSKTTHNTVLEVIWTTVPI